MSERQPPWQAPLERFTTLMWVKLDQNKHKRGWRKSSIQRLLSHLCEETAELLNAFEVERTNTPDHVGPREAFMIAAHHLRCAASALSSIHGTIVTRGAVHLRHPDSSSESWADEEAADVANFAMMIADTVSRMKRPASFLERARKTKAA